MKFDKISNQTASDIAQQIKELIDPFAGQIRLGETPLPEDLSLFESCKEEIIDLPRSWAEAEEQNNLEQWRRQQNTWYHQLRTENQAFGFARSIELGNGSHRVIEVVPSPVAQEFQNACRVLDEEESAHSMSENEPVAFLLYIPLYNFYSLCTRTAGLISRVYPFFPKRSEGPKKLTEPLPAYLRRLPTAFGIMEK